MLQAACLRHLSLIFMKASNNKMETKVPSELSSRGLRLQRRPSYGQHAGVPLTPIEEVYLGLDHLHSNDMFCGFIIRGSKE